MVTRGRARSPIRPGLIVKHTLMGEIPIRETQEYVQEAAIVHLFDAYKGEVDRVNALREKTKRIRGMRYQSFYTMFRFAQLLGLVEFVREEEADWKRKAITTPNTSLLRVEKEDSKAVVRISHRRVFRLTQIGTQDEKCWSDLTRAWKESWAPGQLLEYIPPTQIPPTPPIPPKPVKPVRPVEKPVGFTPYKWVSSPSPSQFRKLLKHLYNLQSLGLDFPGVEEETHKLGQIVGDWEIDAEDSLAAAKSIDNVTAVNKYTLWVRQLSNLMEALWENKLDRSIEALETLV